jgi:hypothetical protein
MPGNRIRMQPYTIAAVYGPPYTIAAVYGPPYTIAAVYDRSRIWFQVSTSAAYTLVFAHNFPHNDPPSYPHNFPHINFYNAPKSTLALARSGNFKLFPILNWTPYTIEPYMAASAHEWTVPRFRHQRTGVCWRERHAHTRIETRRHDTARTNMRKKQTPTAIKIANGTRENFVKNAYANHTLGRQLIRQFSNNLHKIP